MTEPVKTVVGFDFGTKWIGVAVGQTLTRQATPIAAIRNNDWKRIASVLDEWRPQVVVVGLPLNMMGEHQSISARAERFGRQLEGRFGIKAVLIDERLTTREAYQIAIENQRRKSKSEIDSIAAALITESWLREYADTETG
ncbi:MAG: Holliday junction resolvase RuvX [Gammaproteobacteria bacterium]|nr:Holliday junction resolvase RuvX [Gammaproteobacteria bacterium]MDH3447667.1 Holliday junction resolvase RuvX [Gammaproteobacteria bacterium]